MSSLSLQRTHNYVSARRTHPAWLLLASRRAPLTISCLESLFEHNRDGVAFDAAVQALSDVLAAHANQPDFEIEAQEVARQARTEIRDWIRRALIVEREGRIFETDALKTALRFLTQLDGRMMTSTASRLAIVQREIDNLAVQLDPDPLSREQHIQRKLDELEQQMQALREGRIPVLTQELAIEGIREVYSLAMGLRADFRRVEDSWRQADRTLRQSIIGEQLHRGEVVDKLLDGHANLLSTQEGRVFENFHQQLGNQNELEAMRQRIIHILAHPAAEKALDDLQYTDLRLLVQLLLKEAKVVQAVRARSEREVSQFMKSGQAAENHRVGQLINDVLQQAQHIDWNRSATRRQPAPLAPAAIALGTLPLIERLRIKSLDDDAPIELMLARQHTDLNDVEDEFWLAFEGLDRLALIQQTLQVLQQANQPLTLAQLAQHLPPGEHDLETLTLWLAMAREAGIAVPAHECESIETHDGNQTWILTVPKTVLYATDLTDIHWEL